MERGQKRPLDGDQYTGYIHQTSPLKMSKKNSKFFNAVIQTGQDSFKKILSYNLNAHDFLATAEKNKSPVKLTGCGAIADLIDSSQMNVKMVRQTKFGHIRNLDFNYRTFRPTEMAAAAAAPALDKTLLQIAAENNDDNANITVKIGRTMKEATTQRFGRELPLKKVLASDPTSLMPVVLWAELIGECVQGKSYRITEVAKREYQGEQYLTTTRHSVVQLIDDLTDPIDEEDGDTIRGEVTTVSADVEYRCHRCAASVQLGEERTTKCESCGVRQRNRDITKSTKVNFCVNNCDFNVEGDILKNFIALNELDDKSPSDLEVSFLELNELEIVHVGQTVVSIKLL